ncbi:MAG: nucleotidyltransferase family protein [Prevotella sp.]|jgi:hypothetical protein|nr:nucleotidyltransferase family protein [Prevotella sp.]
MDKTQTVFFDFLKFCVGSSTSVSSPLTEAEWNALFQMACKQALIGVLFDGLQRYVRNSYNGGKPGKELILKWYAAYDQIRKQNERMNDSCVWASRKFEHAGFRNCILKGQGLALLYPDPMSRMPGDIDIWLAGGRRKIIDYVNRLCPGQVERYHHIDCPVIPGVPMEVHITPSYMYSPWRNRKMQKWFHSMVDGQCANRVMLPDDGGEISVPTVSFNMVFILSHLYRHLFSEGIGLRQLMDYYFVLRQKVSLEDHNTVVRTIKNLGMKRFAQGVMYVLGTAFGLEKQYMLFDENERDGRFLLEEVMKGGNFGQYDDRLGSKAGETVSHRYFRMSRRNLRFVNRYPSEALCEPLFRTNFFLWKKWKGLK